MARTYYFKNDDESRKYFENEKLMKKNSGEWHSTDDPVKKQELHFKNQVLAGEQDLADGGHRSFDEASGVWSTDYGNKAQTGNKFQSEADSKKFSYVNQDELDALQDEILNGRGFSYNPLNDASYLAYRDMYQREGGRAAKSTLADIAQAQGGVSSYAASAAQQAGNAYAQAVTDKIPELERLAYEKYAAEKNDRYNQYSMLANERNTLYNQFLDNRNYNYQLGRDAENDERYIDERDYQRGIYKDETEYSRNMDAWDMDMAERQVKNSEEWAKNEWGRDEYKMHYDDGVKALASGIMPNDAQLFALNMTQEQAMQYLKNAFPQLYYGYNVNFNKGTGQTGTVPYTGGKTVYDGGSSEKSVYGNEMTAGSGKDGAESMYAQKLQGIDKLFEEYGKAYDSGKISKEEYERTVKSIEDQLWRG